MQNIAITDHRSHEARRAAGGALVLSVARIVMVVAATAFVALVIAWVVAASMGLGADGRRGVGPDRPPAPDLFRWTAGGRTLTGEVLPTE